MNLFSTFKAASVRRGFAPTAEGRGSNPRSKTEKLAPGASLVSVHHLRPRKGLHG